MKDFSTKWNLGLAAVLSFVVFIITLFAGWITNLVWLIQNGFGDWGGEVVVALFGIFFVPVGVIHGIYVWF
jgi:hypothetical protein